MVGERIPTKGSLTQYPMFFQVPGSTLLLFVFSVLINLSLMESSPYAGLLMGQTGQIGHVEISVQRYRNLVSPQPFHRKFVQLSHQLSQSGPTFSCRSILFQEHHRIEAWPPPSKTTSSHVGRSSFSCHNFTVHPERLTTRSCN